jgi:hypothetical protein
MSSTVFGVRADGTLASCRAKPENRGKGTCKHSDHIDVTLEELKTGFLQNYNEKAIETYYKKAGLGEVPPNLRKDKRPAIPSKPSFDPAVLHESSDAVANQFRDEDFEFIQDFYKLYERDITATYEREMAAPDFDAVEARLEYPISKLSEYMASDEPTMKRLREYVGDEVKLEALSEIIHHGVGAMTNAYEWTSSGRNSVSRSILSTLWNNMDKKNYVTSVLFFRGRCCYCNRVLSKGAGNSRLPSGEHITPVKPEHESEVVGGTRYGNMALACKTCNGDRGNKELVSWINTTSCIKRDDKAAALGRIKAFREFTGYKDFTPEHSDRIRKAITDIQVEVEKLRDSTGRLKRGEGASIRKLVADSIVDLSDGNVHPVKFTRYG